MFKKRGLSIPEESRYDRLTAENLYMMLEGNLSAATHLVDVYRGSPEPDKELTLLQTELEGALAATKALRRKLVVVLAKE